MGLIFLLTHLKKRIFVTKFKKTMKKIGIVLAIILGIVLLIGGWAMSTYNKMVGLKEPATSQWANVESAYQRRTDLIPNLVNTVKGYATHEKETLNAVIQARANATKITIDAANLTPENLAAFQNAQAGVTSSLSRLLATFEAYPDLKANQNFLALQSQLEGTENRINVERNKFNKNVQGYNTYIKKAPQNIIANFILILLMI